MLLSRVHYADDFDSTFAILSLFIYYLKFIFAKERRCLNSSLALLEIHLYIKVSSMRIWTSQTKH